ncbi:maltose permease MAL61 [Dactylonectria macrodidyma]|uniref:Maltose permease MAL61 n=1 Tax=Dactylonectria macrodidyma TaxID=307937 RepID=A0A9P9FH96_9HYPO|nr:maltose permease MAL61 [Dactylonectria macrodidyma]
MWRIPGLFLLCYYRRHRRFSLLCWLPTYPRNNTMVHDKQDEMGPVPDNSLNEGSQSMWNVLVEKKRLVGYILFTTIAPVMFGFDNIIVGVVTSMPFFQVTFGQLSGETFILPALWLGLWNAFVQIGIMAGAAANSIFIDKFGRRLGFVLGGVIGTAAVGAIYAADDMESLSGKRGVFLLGKTILGVSLGVLLSTSQTYVSEVAPTRLRGPLLASYTFFMAVGQIIAITLIFKRIAIFNVQAFKVPFAAQWALTGVAIIAGLVIPESPQFHLRRGDISNAKKSFARLNPGHDHDSQFAILQAAYVHEVEAAQATGHDASIKDCFKGTDLRRTRIIVWVNLLQQLLGITLIANGAYFLQLAGMSPVLSLTMSQIGVSLVLVANVISWYTMTRFGRRFIMLASTLVVSALWLSTGIAGCFKSTAALWYIGVCIMVIGFCLQSGVGSAWPVVSAETSSMRLRTQSQAIAWVSNAFFSWLFNFFVPYLFDTDQADLGGKIGFFFSGLCCFGFLIIWFEIPEMKNRTYTELDELFANKVATRKFESYVCDSGHAIAEIVVDLDKQHIEHKE